MVVKRWRELAGLNRREQEEALGGKGEKGDQDPVLQSLLTMDQGFTFFKMLESNRRI